jgi:hypothetical protein
VIAANAQGGDNSIVIPAMTIVLTRPAARYAAGFSAEDGDLDITDHLTIVGADPEQTLIDVNGLNGGFNVPATNFPQPADIDVTLRGLTVFGAAGVGIFSNARSLLLDQVVVRDNHNDNDGGGIKGRLGLITVRDSTIRDNVSDLTGGGFDVASLVIENSAVLDNQAGAGGGGIYTEGLTMLNTTVAGNDGGGDFAGGGVVIGGGSESEIDESTVTNSTIADNHNVDSGGGVAAVNDAPLTMTNTILWGNTAVSGPDCSGAIAETRTSSATRTAAPSPAR